MPRTSCWSPSSAGAAALAAAAVALLAFALLLPAGDAAAATVLERTVTVDVRADGTVRESTRLRVRMDDSDDVDDWSDYYLYLDDHRELAGLDGRVVGVDGKRTKIRRRHRDQTAAGGSFHSSARWLTLELPALAVGSVFEIESEFDVRPYYPAGSVLLAGDDAVESLRVEVGGAGDGWRWTLKGEREGVAVRERAGGGLAVTASGLAAVEPGEDEEALVLHYAWRGDDDWAAIGRWYGELLVGLPRAEPAVRAAARDEIVDDRRRTLEALTGFVQQQVRYVDVEVGIGGFRPSPPHEVLDRRWGDCKDKALLLVDLLAEAGIAAHPALVYSGGRRLLTDFPSPFQFNHVIVAVPASQVPVGDADAVAGGYLFVDPTQPKGGADWLHPGVQEQEALVVLAGGGELVRLPVLADEEGTELVVNVRLDAAGDAAGGASYRMHGRRALGLLTELENGATDEVEARLRDVFAFLLPGVDLGAVGWVPGEAGALSIDLSAAVRVPRLVQGLSPEVVATGGRASLTLPALRAVPEQRDLDAAKDDFEARPANHSIVWHVAVPPGCSPPREKVTEAANEAGSFRQEVRHQPSGFTVERRTRIAHRWYEGELLAALAEIGLAENQALRRRVRFSCGAAAEEEDEEAGQASEVAAGLVPAGR